MKLQTLGIVFGTFDTNNLLDLLKSQANLHSLQLLSVDLAGHGQWPRAFRGMASHMRLEYAHWRNLAQGAGFLSDERLCLMPGFGQEIAIVVSCTKGHVTLSEVWND